MIVIFSFLLWVVLCFVWIVAKDISEWSESDRKSRCSHFVKKLGVVPGVSWGKVRRNEQQEEWRSLKCDELVQKKEETGISSASITPVDSELNLYEVCQNMQQTYNIVPEKSWGRIQHMASLRAKWNSYECNTVLKLKRSVDCDELYGRQFLTSWQTTTYPVCSAPVSSPQSLPVAYDESAYCRVSVRDNVACFFPQVVIDINKLHPSSKNRINPSATRVSRSFESGYLTVPSCPNSPVSASWYTPLHDTMPEVTYSTAPLDLEQCSRVISEPVMIVSHDHVYNLGHLFEDVMNWWLAGALSGRPLKTLSVLNIDGLKAGTVMSGRGRYIGNVKSPDGFGPFKEMFDVLFHQTYSLYSDLTADRPRVCLAGGIFFYPSPIKSFLWEKFEVVDPCSKKMTSSHLYTSFHDTLMTSWLKYGDLTSQYQAISALSNPPSPIYSSATSSSSSKPLTILLLERQEKDMTSVSPLYQARVLANLGKIQLALVTFASNLHIRTRQPVAVYSFDLSSLTYAQQVAFVFHEVDVLIGFHGAGMNHLFHMNRKRPDCCAVIEIFPQKSGCDAAASASGVCSLHVRKGYGNHARYMGFRYKAVQAAEGSFYRTQGTTIQPRHLIAKLNQTISEMTSFRSNSTL